MKQKIKVALHTTDGQKHEISLEDMLEWIGVPKAKTVWVELSVRTDEGALEAYTFPNEDAYPGILVDGTDKDGAVFYLAEAELPNADYPQDITSRLYAGNSDYEQGDPIALVRHRVNDPEYKAWCSQNTGLNPSLRKIVYVDMDVAESRTWAEPYTKEHVQDVPRYPEDILEKEILRHR